MFCQQVIIHPRDFNWYKVILKLFVWSGYIMETNCSCLTIKSRPFIKCPPGSWTISNLCLWSSPALMLDKQLEEENDTSSAGSSSDSDGQTNNNIYEEILSTIYCFLHWREINGIFRKMKLLVWGRGRSGIGKYDQARNICVITAAPRDRSV